MKTAFLAFTALSCAAVFAQNPSTVTNLTVIEMVKAKVPSPAIVQLIATTQPAPAFHLDPGSLNQLTSEGVPDDVVKAMAARKVGHAIGGSLHQRNDDLGPVDDGKVRVYVVGSDSWSSFTSRDGSGSGGARPQTAEIMKTFGESCQDMVVTNKREYADYIVQLEHEGGKTWLQHDNKLVVFDVTGDMVYHASTLGLGNAVRGFCGSRRNQLAFTGHPSSTPYAANR